MSKAFRFKVGDILKRKWNVTFVELPRNVMVLRHIPKSDDPLEGKFYFSDVYVLLDLSSNVQYHETLLTVQQSYSRVA